MSSTQVFSGPDIETYKPVFGLLTRRPVLVKQNNSYRGEVFAKRPLLGPLLFDNNASDARDHCANERTFLSWLRLAVYLAIVSVAILVSFHLKQQPSKLEKRIALPLGIVFWLLALACLVSGVANYVKTVTRYSKRMALVQSGWKTEIVFTVVAVSIVAACVLFLSTNKGEKS
ncbi:hypothetical protein EJ05DRAFT_496424 [Pseudovirgaria hyperparasitica]|uniref:DUF202 domain-containing protein n=1 Tax=Pseudovirgaria hyperparasitica TaxID=470096 RepID=A0A6A6WJJ1_9PEZI|nr:uncharacterized protein EJ05DRAFT_496424 [Pseudovirgaria hyperparasitica]KAF2761511.1 hypothetical protein EJ05DRAFT_496424 [Pseudovirgaria hyperparasitica]